MCTCAWKEARNVYLGCVIRRDSSYHKSRFQVMLSLRPENLQIFIHKFYTYIRNRVLHRRNFSITRNCFKYSLARFRFENRSDNHRNNYTELNHWFVLWILPSCSLSLSLSTQRNIYRTCLSAIVLPTDTPTEKITWWQIDINILDVLVSVFFHSSIALLHCKVNFSPK